MDEKLRRHLYNARREIKIAVERFAKLEETVGAREGHRVEALRRIREVKVEADKAMEAFSE